MPVLHMIAGPHGAGKSTLYRYLIEPRFPTLPFVDPQSDGAEKRRQELLMAGASYVNETVLAHPSPLALMTQARALGYEVTLYALALDDPERLVARVRQRLREGGHAVPAQTVLERYPRTLEHLRRAVRLADLVFLMDAQDIDGGGPRLVASIVKGQMQLHALARPRWVDETLGLSATR
jgi:predicted ABC-type ATPase